MEDAALVMKWLARLFALSLFSSAQSAEVFRRLRYNVVVELKYDAAGLFPIDVDVEKNFGTFGSHCKISKQHKKQLNEFFDKKKFFAT